jgi:DNA-binding NtrC family response regulator
MKDKGHSPRGVVLVIDDEAPVREAVVDILAFINVAVVIARNGYEGIHIYQERMAEIALILLDLSMPGLSGQETLQQLRRLNPAVKVILSSGYSAAEVRSQFDKATDFLQKPYDVGQLIDLVSQYLPSG